jgi:hypothetical protein
MELSRCRTGFEQAFEAKRFHELNHLGGMEPQAGGDIGGRTWATPQQVQDFLSSGGRRTLFAACLVFRDHFGGRLPNT